MAIKNYVTPQKTWISCQAATHVLKDIWKRWTRVFKVIDNQATGRGRTSREWENELCNRRQSRKNKSGNGVSSLTLTTDNISLMSFRNKFPTQARTAARMWFCCAHTWVEATFKKSRRVALCCLTLRAAALNAAGLVKRERKFSVGEKTISLFRISKF